MRQTVKARTINEITKDVFDKPTKTTSSHWPNSLLIIFIICLSSDVFLLSQLAPHMVLSGPTPVDTMSQAALPCLVTCMTIFLIGLVNKFWVSRLACVSMGLVKVLVVVDLAYNLFNGSFNTNVFESTIVLAYTVFYSSVGLLFSLAAINFQSKNKLKLSTINLIVFTSLIALAQITFLNKISNLEQLISSSLLEYLIYSSLAYVVLNIAIWIYLSKNKIPDTISYTKMLPIADQNILFHMVLLTISTCFIWTPLYTCFANSSSISSKFLDISLFLYFGAFSITIFSKYLKARTNLVFCTTIPLFLVLSISRWDILTTPSLVLLGALLTIVSINSIKQICLMHNCPLKPLSLSLVAIITFSFAGGLLLSNPQAVLPPAYVMQSIGFVFFLISIFTAFKFIETRQLILKFAASNLLLFRANLLLAKKQIRERNHSLIVSRLNLIETIVVANYLICPIFIVSNDGFLNLTITKFFLEFFNARIFSNESKAISMAKISLDNQRTPVVHFQNLSYDTSQEFFYSLVNKRKVGKKPMYTIEMNPRLENKPLLVSKISASHTVSR